MHEGNSSVTTALSPFVNNHYPSCLEAHTFDIRNAIASSVVETFQANTGGAVTVHLAAVHYAFVRLITLLTNP